MQNKFYGKRVLCCQGMLSALLYKKVAIG